MTRQEKNYNLNYLKEISGGDEHFVSEMIEYFVLNTPEILIQLNRYYQNGELEKLGNQAHKFASNVAFLGAQQLDDLLEQVHINVQQNEKLNDIPQMLKIIEEKCQTIVIELKEDFNL